MAKGLKLPTRGFVKNDQNAMTERPDVPRSRFVGTHTLNTTIGPGRLYPILVEEVLPGDLMRFKVNLYIRMQTALFPLFDNQRVETHFFFVPNRLVWRDWARFMGEQDNTDDVISDFVVPRMRSTGGFGFQRFSVPDYMGLPVRGNINGAQETASALPYRAYRLIWNEWYRDQNLQNKLQINLTSSDDTVPDDEKPLPRAKLKDYFTTALPWPQKFQSPTVPVTGRVPVQGIGGVNNNATYNNFPTGFRETTLDGTLRTTTYNIWTDAQTSPIGMVMRGQDIGGFYVPNVFVDLANAVGAPLNGLRQAWLIQQLLERDARGGTRYTEIVRSHFGVVSPDARLQRPEFIGGGRQMLNITPVAATTPTAFGNVGDLSGVGTSYGEHSCSVAATEHGFIIGLLSIQSEIAYQQGVPRMWDRRTRYDFYWPSLAHLGEQAVLRRELYAVGDTATESQVFGYQERWHEYRQRYSQVTGGMRTVPGAASLDAWHLAQFFNASPSLNQSFIVDNPPMARVLAVTDGAPEEIFLVNAQFMRDAVRPIPVFGTPVALGRM